MGRAFPRFHVLSKVGTGYAAACTRHVRPRTIPGTIPWSGTNFAGASVVAGASGLATTPGALVATPEEFNGLALKDDGTVRRRGVVEQLVLEFRARHRRAAPHLRAALSLTVIARLAQSFALQCKNSCKPGRRSGWMAPRPRFMHTTTERAADRHP
jgi:hypothetical protein